MGGRSSVAMPLIYINIMYGSALNQLYFVPLTILVGRDSGYQPNIKEQFKDMPVITRPTSDDQSTVPVCTPKFYIIIVLFVNTATDNYTFR